MTRIDIHKAVIPKVLAQLVHARAQITDQRDHPANAYWRGQVSALSNVLDILGVNDERRLS